MSGEAIVCGGRNWASSIQFAMSGRDYRGYRTVRIIKTQISATRFE